MKAQHYIKKVKESKEFKDFIKSDPKSYLCSVFFVRDFTEGKNETQVDFYSPKKKKIISFKAEGKIEKMLDKKAQTLGNKKFIPKELKEITKIDIDEIKSTLQDEMHNREMTYTIEKVLAFLTTMDDKPVWNCTGFLQGLGLLQAHVDDETNTVLFMDKKSLFDMIKFTGQGLGAGAGQGLPGATGAGGVQVQPEQPQVAQQPAGKKPSIKIVSEEEFKKMIEAQKKEVEKAEKSDKKAKKK
ncbi:MAG: hypothetical protein ABSG05_02680 [Candidatus Pacearchaeota archaeon]|jgi:hypothetical protein